MVTDKKFHSACFTCDKCSKKLGGSAFIEHENKYYCEKDYMELFAVNCAVCEKPILGMKYALLDDKKVHNECFKCSKCNNIIEAEYFIED